MSQSFAYNQSTPLVNWTWIIQNMWLEKVHRGPHSLTHCPTDVNYLHTTTSMIEPWTWKLCLPQKDTTFTMTSLQATAHLVLSENTVVSHQSPRVLSHHPSHLTRGPVMHCPLSHLSLSHSEDLHPSLIKHAVPHLTIPPLLANSTWLFWGCDFAHSWHRLCLVAPSLLIILNMEVMWSWAVIGVCSL